MATTRDPFTGEITFKNPNQVINTVTGQTASSLTPAVAPSNVAQVNPIPSVQMPQGGATLPDTSLANSTNAGSKVVVANTEKQLAQEQADFTARQIETEKARQKESQSSLLSIFSNRQSRQDVTAQQESRFGVDTQQYLADRKQVTAEQDSLQNEYALAVNDLEEQKSALEGQGRGVPISLLNNQAAQMERNAAPKLNRLSAQINAKSAEGARLDGNFQLAQSLIQKSVDNILADQKDEIDIRMEFYKQNLESFDRISSIYKDAYLSNIKTLEKKYDQDREDKSFIGSLMINPDYAGAGILVTDSLEEAQTKASQWIVNNPSLDDRLKQAKINEIYNANKGGSGVFSKGFISSKIETSVREDVVSLLYTEKLSPEDSFKRLRTLYSPSEVSDSALKELLGLGAQTALGENEPVNVVDSLKTGINPFKKTPKTRTPTQGGITTFGNTDSFNGAASTGISSFFSSLNNPF